MASLLCAMAYAVMFVGRIPIIAHLSYDPKDIVIVFGGFVFGPLMVVIISVIVPLIEMITASNTAIIGMIMNILSSLAFALPAVLIYYRRKSLKNAIIGLIVGVIVNVAAMLLFNYFISPFYFNIPQAEIAKMLLPIFLPFNLIKGSINAALILLLYPHLVKVFESLNLLNKTNTKRTNKKTTYIVVFLLLLFSLIIFLFMKGII